MAGSAQPEPFDEDVVVQEETRDVAHAVARTVGAMREGARPGDAALESLRSK